MYLIWSNEVKAWWTRPEQGGRFGFTTDITEAGHFPFNVAIVMTDQANEGVAKGEPLNEVMFELPPFPMGTLRK
jgi:hypothetical protein